MNKMTEKITISIMQPYFFPYIGYYQMISAVDKFILYDDVNYIKGGWINRNRILDSNKYLYIHLILNGASPNKQINELTLNRDLPWKSKLLRQIQSLYKKAPYFEEVFPFLEDIIIADFSELSIYLVNCISKTSEYLGITTEIVPSSTIYDNQNLKRQERLIDICKKENASQYVNAIGGVELYSKDEFKKDDIDLFFIETREIKYQQYNNNFIPNLSIIDVMMFNSKNEIQDMLNRYNLI